MMRKMYITNRNRKIDENLVSNEVIETINGKSKHKICQLIIENNDEIKMVELMVRTKVK